MFSFIPHVRPPGYHGFLDEILQPVQAAVLIAAVLPLNGVLQRFQVVHGLFGIAEKL